MKKPIRYRQSAMIWTALAAASMAMVAIVAGPGVFLISPLIVPMLWMGFYAAGFLGSDRSIRSREQIYRAFVMAGVSVFMIAIGYTVFLALGGKVSVTADLVLAIVGISLILSGNQLPKKMDSDAAPSQTAVDRRFLAWLFVLAGGCFMAIALLPLGEAFSVRLSVLVAALMILLTASHRFRNPI